MTAAVIELQERAPGKFAASGPLTFATARVARDSGLAAFGASSAREIEVDCGGITASDSGGMTVLLDWLTFAKRSGKALRYEGLPEQVQALARIADVLELLEKGV